jgi:hypothetical protein
MDTPSPPSTIEIIDLRAKTTQIFGSKEVKVII